MVVNCYFFDLRNITVKLIILLFLCGLTTLRLDAQSGEVSINIYQESKLYHKPLSIKVQNLPPKIKVKLSLEVVDAKQHNWQSEAYYISDRNGTIDLHLAPSVGGSYIGIYPMGLFWSLKSKNYHQIATNQGFEANLKVSLGEKLLAEQSIYRQSTRELDQLDIQRTLKRDSIVANYYLPKSEEKLPAIIFIGGSGGNFREERASLYASEGFAVLDLKYFRGDGLPDGIIEIPLEYVHKAHLWLMKQPKIDKSKIGITGRSRGSELAILYATEFDVSYVIAQVPSNVVWFGWEDNKSSWSYQNKPYPYAEYSDEESTRIELEMREKGIQYHDGPKFLSAFKNPKMIERTAIPIEKINCPILFVSGKDDKVWPSAMMADRLVRRLIEKDFKHEFLHLSYADAGHNFAGGGQGCGIPFLPAEDYSNSSARGGTDKGNAIAAIHSWEAILSFIYRQLANQ